MKIISKASMKRIEDALLSAYSAVLQDVSGDWKMPVSTFTAVTDSLIKISVELGVDLVPTINEQFEVLISQVKSAENRLNAAKELKRKLGGPQNEPFN